MLPRSTRQASIVMPVSEATADKLVSFLDVPRSKMVVIPSAIGEPFRPVGADRVHTFCRQYGLPDSFWLYVSHYYPHKNHIGLFKAYREVRRRTGIDWPLVLCGNKNGADALISRMVEEAEVSDMVVWLSDLPDAEMPCLYSAATALVFPSLYEGGGIPILEAMSCGCAVVASDIPAVREFAGEAALTFPPGDCQALGKAMEQIATDSALRQQCRETGLERSNAFRPAHIAQRLLAVYQTAAGIDARTAP
jgi:glycosyltransferase involved in cell wall biosynthesis